MSRFEKIANPRQTRARANFLKPEQMINKYTLIAPLLLLGCATPDDLLRSQADLVFRSAKDAQSVATCLAGQWKTFSLPGSAAVPTALRETLGTYVLTASCHGGKSCKLAEITPTHDQQSKTTMYSIAVGEGSYLDAVDYCQ